jgi:hypothetical protein
LLEAKEIKQDGMIEHGVKPAGKEVIVVVQLQMYYDIMIGFFHFIQIEEEENHNMALQVIEQV